MRYLALPVIPTDPRFDRATSSSTPTDMAGVLEHAVRHDLDGSTMPRPTVSSS